jgi:hypothetical protein
MFYNHSEYLTYRGLDIEYDTFFDQYTIKDIINLNTPWVSCDYFSNDNEDNDNEDDNDNNNMYISVVFELNNCDDTLQFKIMSVEGLLVIEENQVNYIKTCNFFYDMYNTNQLLFIT